MWSRAQTSAGIFGALVLFVSAGCFSADQPTPGWAAPLVADTEQAACEVLKAAVVRQRHLPADTPSVWKWYCDFSTIEDKYLRIVALRAGRCDAFSCLMGWFAVMRRSTVVLGWDLNQDRVVPLDGYR
jgi:hypothetical protein